jgi:hypothetical protein
MSVQVRDYLKHRRDRALGTILGNAEKTFWPRLTPEQRDTFRLVVVGAIDSYHDSVLDLVKAESAERNDVVIELLERIDRKVPPRHSAT